MDFHFLPLLIEEYKEVDDFFKTTEKRNVNLFFCVIQILCLQVVFGGIFDLGLEK